METFKAFRIFNEDDRIAGRVVDMTLDDLVAGEVAVHDRVFERQLQGRARRHAAPAARSSAAIPLTRRHRRGGHGGRLDRSRASSPATR